MGKVYSSSAFAIRKTEKYDCRFGNFYIILTNMLDK